MASEQNKKNIMSLREQVTKYIQEQGIPFVAEKLGKKESTVKLWFRTGRYPLELIELMQDRGYPEQPDPGNAPEIVSAAIVTREWTPEDLDRLEASMITHGERLQELNVRLIDIEDRHNPKPVIPQIASATVPPAVLDDAGFVAANQVRPGPISPTPHMIRGEPPPAMLPPPQMIAPHPQNRYSTWLEPFRPRERKY